MRFALFSPVMDIPHRVFKLRCLNSLAESSSAILALPDLDRLYIFSPLGNVASARFSARDRQIRDGNDLTRPQI